MAIRKSQIYSSLWASCDARSGGVDASQLLKLPFEVMETTESILKILLPISRSLQPTLYMRRW